MTIVADKDTEALSLSAAEAEVGQRARHRIARRLLPFLFLLYVIAFVDRMNVGAAALQMPHDLGFSAGVIGSPLAGLLLGLSWLGLRGWRWLFIIEGVPAIVVGVITIWYLTDWPEQAHWLPSDEKSWIKAELQREKEAKNCHRSYRVWEALRHRDVILLTGCYFCAMTGSYGIAFWLPTILKRLSGKSDFKVTLLAALPYVAAFITQQVNGWHSDRTQERRWDTAIPIFVCGVALALAVVYRTNLTMAVAL